MADIDLLANRVKNLTPVLTRGVWGGGDHEQMLGLCIEAYQSIKALPPTANFKPLCEALAPLARALDECQPQLWAVLKATRDSDVEGLMCRLNQATAGAYVAGLVLQSSLPLSPAAAKGDLLVRLGSAAVASIRTSLTAVHRLAGALARRRGGLASLTADTLRRRLPFLLGLVQRPWALLSDLPAGDALWLKELLRTAWRPAAVMEMCVLGAKASVPLLRTEVPGSPHMLAGAYAHLTVSLVYDQQLPQGSRLAASATVEQQRELAAPLPAVLDRMVDVLLGGQGGGLDANMLSEVVFQQLWEQGMHAVHLVCVSPDWQRFSSEQLSVVMDASSRAMGAFNAAMSALPAGQVPAWAEMAASCVRVALVAASGTFTAGDSGLDAADWTGESGMHKLRAVLLGQRHVPAAMQLLRALLCAVAAAPAGERRLVGKVAPQLLQAATSLCSTLVWLDPERLGPAVPGLVLFPDRNNASSAQQGLSVLAAVAEACMRCLADRPALGTAMTRLRSAAAASGKQSLVEGSQGLLAVLESSAACLLTAAANATAAALVAPQAPPLAAAVDSCAALAATACKLPLVLAASEQLRAQLADEVAVMGSFWTAAVVESGLELVLAAAAVADNQGRGAGDQEAQQRRQRQVQATALAALAALRASHSFGGHLEAAGSGAGNASTREVSHRLDEATVHMLCKLFAEEGVHSLLVSEGALSEVAAAAVRMLARPAMDEVAAEALCDACGDTYGLALSIAAQPGFAELASAPGQGGFAHVASCQHGSVFHAVESNAIKELEQDQAEQLNAVAVRVRAAGLGGMLPILRQHKLLLARMAAEQLVEEPPGPIKGSPEDAALSVERTQALATRACSNPGCANVAGASEAALASRRCSGCRTARFCSTPCSKAEWKRHKLACRALSAA